MSKLEDPDAPPPEGYHFPLLFTWALPPLSRPPDLLVLATDLAGLGGTELPLEVSAIDSTASVVDAPEHRISMVARVSVALADVYSQDDSTFCGIFDRCSEVSLFLLRLAPSWMDEN